MNTDEPYAASGGGSGRRASIAEAGLRILAREGGRGLTHRAVDRELELPQGSTSHYFRTRLELLTAICHFQVAMNRRDLEWMDAIAPSDGGDPWDAESFSEKLAATYALWLSPEHRWRTVARCEMFLAATREQALDDVLNIGTAAFLAQLGRVFAMLGAADPAPAARAFLMSGNGLLFGYAISSPAPIDPAELRASILINVRHVCGI